MNTHTSYKGRVEETRCQPSRPQQKNTPTRWVQLDPTDEEEDRPASYDIWNSIEPPSIAFWIRRNVYKQPLHEKDDRLIIWELHRPSFNMKKPETQEENLVSELEKWRVKFANFQEDLKKRLRNLTPLQKIAMSDAFANRNEMVMEYNVMITALLGCNTNTSILGSDVPGFHKAQC